MKKVIGILGVVAIAMTMFFSTSTNNNNDTDLASLIAINTANAEDGSGGCRYTGIYNDRCVKSGFQVASCVNNSVTQNCSW